MAAHAQNRVAGVASPSFFPGTYSASQHHAPRALNCACEHQCFISIYFVYLLARCDKVIASSSLTCERFHENPLLSDSEGNLSLVFMKQIKGRSIY